jgi:hypothetical protein
MDIEKLTPPPLPNFGKSFREAMAYRFLYAEIQSNKDRRNAKDEAKRAVALADALIAELEKEPIVKGDFEGECNSSVCTIVPATWYHTGNSHFYCSGCATVMNKKNHDPFSPFQRVICVRSFDGKEGKDE